MSGRFVGRWEPNQIREDEGTRVVDVGSVGASLLRSHALLSQGDRTLWVRCGSGGTLCFGWTVR